MLVSGCVSSLSAPLPVRAVAVPPSSPAPSPTPSRKLPPGPVRFVDVTARAGLRYRWTIPGSRPINALQGIGNGCAFLDYDNDGSLDILLVGTPLALYRGDGKGHFEDVTAQAGLRTLSGHFLGCAVGDYDNDGFDDIYISGYRTGILLHNERGKRFTEVSKATGLPQQPWGTSCTFADLDGDGLLDLYVTNYLDFGPKSKQLCPARGVLTSCGPLMYHELKGVCFQNEGGTHFRDVTRRWGLNRHTGNGLGVATADFDGSGRIGLAIANDELGGDLFQNRGNGHLVNINVAAGVATDRYGNAHGGMGIDWGDYDNDGKPDLFVATYQDQVKCLYHNQGDRLFHEESDVLGIEAPTLPYVAWGCKFLDADNDGWLDLLIANGHLQDNVAQIPATGLPVPRTFRQRSQFLHNSGNPAVFVDASSHAGPAFTRPLVGRGLAIGDYDNDGRMDALIVDSEGTPVLLHNATPASECGHFLGLLLIGSGRSNRDGYGTEVTVTIADGKGERTLTRFCHADGSYLSSSDKRVHFGLGSDSHPKIKRVVVRWPDGKTQEVGIGGAIDRYLRVTEGT